MHLIYVCNNDVSVYESQVLCLLDYLVCQKQINVTLIQGFANKQEKDSLQKKLSGFPRIHVKWVKIYPLYRIFLPLVLKHYKQVLLPLLNNPHTIIHVRSEYLGFVFKVLTESMRRMIPVLVDVRGVMTEEWKYRILRTKGIRRILTGIQKKDFEKMSKALFGKFPKTMAVTSVSETISDYLEKKYQIQKNKLYVNPNIAGVQFEYSENDRVRIRNKYGVKDNEKLAVCSTGGGDIWQKDVFVIPELLKNGIRVINLAKKDPCIEGCITTTIPFQEMPAMLSAADIAVLWREDTFMNNSASPSKFSEFAKMGLYVIHNGSVDIAKEYIVSSGAGVIINDVKSIEKLTIPISPEKRMKWVQLGTEKFGINSIGEHYMDIYMSLFDDLDNNN